MNSHDVFEILAKPLSVQLLGSSIPARFAYTGLDGDPRVIPIGFLWTGDQVKLYTVPASAKVKALEAHPRVAITIDTQAFPPNVLLIRGKATLEAWWRACPTATSRHREGWSAPSRCPRGRPEFVPSTSRWSSSR